MVGRPGPSVFIVHGAFVINRKNDYGKNECFKEIPFEVGKKYHLKLQQIHKLEQAQWKTFCTLYVNGLQVHSKRVNKPVKYNKVAVYVSHPSHAAFTSEYGILQNFKYTRGN